MDSFAMPKLFCICTKHEFILAYVFVQLLSSFRSIQPKNIKRENTENLKKKLSALSLLLCCLEIQTLLYTFKKIEKHLA